MEWTDAARNELEQILTQVHLSLNPNEVDPDEVLSDLRLRITEELNDHSGSIISQKTVRDTAKKIGIPEITADPHNEEFIETLEKPKRMWTRFKVVCFWFSGIILPLIALGIEFFTHICLEGGLPDPLPTPFHALLILSVPLFNFIAWRHCKKETNKIPAYLGPLGGIALITAIYYSILFITITPYALMGFIAIIYFGIGLLSFLPLSPLLSLIATTGIISKQRKFSDERNKLNFRTLKWGLLAGFSMLALFSAPMYLTKAGLSMSVDKNPKTSHKGIKLLRAIGDKALMNRACYHGANFPLDPISWLLPGEKVSASKARDIYYRVTGEAFNTKASPTLGVTARRNPGDEYTWDPEQGGDMVAGRLKGLSLSDSRMDGAIQAHASTAYLEWTMVFKNEYHDLREARAQIALPPGAVVSRLTLWIDGEEREAAFGGRSQVKQAYKKVVRRRRDPVLVTTSGPDRVLMQCYPVPSNGEMKIRIGITAPLKTPGPTERQLHLPRFLERNFSIPQQTLHAIWIKDHMVKDLTDRQLNAPENFIQLTNDTMRCSSPHKDQLIVQEIRSTAQENIERLHVVIDTSKNMDSFWPEIQQALTEWKNKIPLTIWLADDIPEEISINDLAKINPKGGKDNSAALRKAFLSKDATHVIWIHGPQGWSLGSGEKVRQAMERNRTLHLYDFQVGNGPHRLVEKMDSITGFQTVPRTSSAKRDLLTLLNSLTPGHQSWTAERIKTGRTENTYTPADQHLVKLYALDQIRNDLADGNSDKETALSLALEHHLVTPVSGAVVLETEQQYKDANLKPVDNKMVPNVPEPDTLTLLTLAGLLTFYGRRIVRHIRNKLDMI